MNKLSLLIIFYISLSFSFEKNGKILKLQKKTSLYGLECKDFLQVEDSLSFVFFFKKIIKDEVLRNSSFQNIDSEYKTIFVNRLNQLEDAILYRDEVMKTDTLVSVLFYDESLIFYKANFLKHKDNWYLKSLEKEQSAQICVLSDFKKEKNRIIYKPNCIDKKFIGVIDAYGEADTVYNGNNVLKYAFSNSFLFYNECRKLPSDFQYKMDGLGSGIGGYAEYKHNCLFKYWDASN